MKTQATISRARQIVVESYHRRRKAINENIGLIIALIASAAAVGSFYEARMSRRDARDALDRSIGEQKRLVDAQIRAQQYSVGPILSVKPLGKPLLTKGHNHRILDAQFQVVVVGQTPALDVMVSDACGPNHQVNNRSVGESGTEIPGAHSEPIIFGHVVSGTAERPVTCHLEVDENDPTVVMYIEASYKDVFGNLYFMNYCYDADLSVEVTMRACTNFNPEFSISTPPGSTWSSR